MPEKTTGKIIELPPHIAEKIAAGEIIDRPVSVVKELLENAIDSGADQIVIEIKNGGKALIRITDNGAGIDPTEVETAFKRHATSKIRSVEDLGHVTSLGFRGEALASIAAVSRVELITKTRDNRTGMMIRIAGGIRETLSETGCPEGTTVIVEDLFWNVPARRKFMKSDAAESGLIIDLVSRLAIAYPAVRFRLITNGNVLFSTPGKGEIPQALMTVFGREIATGLIPAEHGPEAGIRVRAYVSPVGVSRTNKRYQIYFVNGRLVSSKTIDQALAEAYREKLPDGRHPVAILYVEADPASLDVNIHPNKKEIRFDDDTAVQSRIREAVSAALRQKNAIPEIRTADFSLPKEPHPPNEKQVFVDVNRLFETKRHAQSDLVAASIEEIPSSYPEDGDAGSPGPFQAGNLEVTGSIFNTYIMAVDRDHFYMIDQHAAHERVFYERLMDIYERGERYGQALLTPIVIELAQTDPGQMAFWSKTLNAFGFQIEPFGVRSCVVKAVPAFMALGEAKAFLDDFIDNAAEEKDFRNSKQIGRIIMQACKRAVKAHDPLSMEEMRQLLVDLAATRDPFTCPHGRPVLLKLGRHDIEKLFKRL